MLVPVAATGGDVRCTQYVSPFGVLNELTKIWPAAGFMVRAISQSVPTPTTSELAAVVTIVPFGAPAAALAARLAAPTSDGTAPVNPITVIDAASELFMTAVTVMLACAGVVNAHQISAVPSCAFERTALVHVNAVPVLLMPFTIVFTPSTGASAETNATNSVFAPGVNAGLVTVRFGKPAFRLAVTVIAGPAVPVETTSATALPCGAVPGLVGVWLITLPA